LDFSQVAVGLFGRRGSALAILVDRQITRNFAQAWASCVWSAYQLTDLAKPLDVSNAGREDGGHGAG
jgi:hypothetical protein